MRSAGANASGTSPVSAAAMTPTGMAGNMHLRMAGTCFLAHLVRLWRMPRSRPSAVRVLSRRSAQNAWSQT